MDVFEDEIIQAEIDSLLAAQEAEHSLHEAVGAVGTGNPTNTLPSGELKLADDAAFLSAEGAVGVVVLFLAISALVAISKRGSKQQLLNTLLAAQAPWTAEHCKEVADALHNASTDRLSEASCDLLITGLQASAAAASASLSPSVTELERRVAAVAEGRVDKATEGGWTTLPVANVPKLLDDANELLRQLRRCTDAAASTPAATRGAWPSLLCSLQGPTGLSVVTKRAGALLERLRDTGAQLLKEADKNKKDVYSRMDCVRTVLMLMHACGFPGAEGVQSVLSGSSLRPRHKKSKSSWTGRQSLSARMSRARASSRMSMDTPRLNSARDKAVAEPSCLAQMLCSELACLEELAEVGEALFDAHTVAKEVYDKAMGREPAARTETIMGRRTGPVLLAANEESDVRKVGRGGEGTAAVNRLTALMQYREPTLSPIVEMEHVSVDEVMQQSQRAAERAAPALVQALHRAAEDLEEAVQRYEDKVKAAGRHYAGVLTDVATGNTARTLSGDRELRSAVELLPKLEHMLRESSTLTLLLTQRAKEQALTSLQQASASQARNATGDVARVAIPLGLPDVGLLLAEANRARHEEEAEGEGADVDGMQGAADFEQEGTPSGEEDDEASAVNPSVRGAASHSVRGSRSLITTSSSALGTPASHQEQLLGMYFSGYAVVQAQAVAAMQEQGLRQQISIVQTERHHLALMLENRNNATVVADAFRKGLESLARAMTEQQEKQSEAIKQASTATTRALYYAEASRAATEARKEDMLVLDAWKRGCLVFLRGLAFAFAVTAVTVIVLDQVSRFGPALYKSFASVRAFWSLVPQCNPLSGEETSVAAASADAAASSSSWWRRVASSASSAASWFSGSTLCFMHWVAFITLLCTGGLSVFMLIPVLLSSLSGTMSLVLSVLAFAWRFRAELADLLPAAGVVAAIFSIMWLFLRYVVVECCFLPAVPPLGVYEERILDRIMSRAERGQGQGSAQQGMGWPTGLAKSAHLNGLVRQAIVSLGLCTALLLGVASGIWTSRSVPRPVPEALYPPMLYGACDSEETRELGGTIDYHGVTSLRLPGLLLTARLTQCALTTGTSTLSTILLWTGRQLWQAATKNT